MLCAASVLLPRQEAFVKVFSTMLRCVPVLFVAAVIAACADSVAPTAPIRRLEVELAKTNHFVAKGKIVRRTRDIDVESRATRRVGPRGGYVYHRKAGLYLLIPEGALASEMDITIVAHAGNRVVYTFEPHGTVFAKPIYVIQEIRYTELNTPRSERNRPEVWGGYLENGMVDITPEGDGLFTEWFPGFYHGKGNDALAFFTTTHFSGYAMASGRRESTSTGE